MSAYHKTAQHLNFVAAADIAAGTLVQVAGKAGIVANDYATGELAAADIWAQVRIPNTDGLTFSDGDTVGYDQVNDKATAALGGTFDCGTAIGDVAATDSHAVVLLNGN